MKAFPLKHTVLYAKNHYPKTGDIWKDLKTVLEADDYIPENKSDVFSIISHKVQAFLLDNTSPEYNLNTFLIGLDPKQCWKYGYYTKGCIWLEHDENYKDLPIYDYHTAFLYSALSLFTYCSLTELGWTEWPELNKSLILKKKSKEIVS